MAKIKSAKSSKENPEVNKAVVKAFIMATFQDKPSKNASISDTSVTKRPTPMDVVTTNVTLALILKQTKNQKK